MRLAECAAATECGFAERAQVQFSDVTHTLPHIATALHHMMIEGQLSRGCDETRQIS